MVWKTRIGKTCFFYSVSHSHGSEPNLDMRSFHNINVIYCGVWSRFHDFVFNGIGSLLQNLLVDSFEDMHHSGDRTGENFAVVRALLVPSSKMLLLHWSVSVQCER